MTFTFIDFNTGSDSVLTDEAIANFLFTHLDQYGDKKEDILRCIDYVINRGGFVLVATEHNNIKGVVIINETGMSGYIPENILVYIAVHQDQRGKGLGRALMEHAIQRAKGHVALHVEPDNPARFLYEKLGFTSKYLEMRLAR
jgi:ribosomal-protein-alanine N-acetyltransferase